MSFISQRRGVSIRMFLADGTPDGLRLVEKSNWNGLAVMCSRAQYPEVRERPEFSKLGVYLLFGPPPSSSGRQNIYIGHADFAREHRDKHHWNRDFWTHLILFVSQDLFFNKAHVQYLESRLIELANRARRVEVEHGNALQTPFLSEADTADAEAFLEDMLLIYPVLGVTAFDVVDKANDPSQPQQRDVLRLQLLDAEATGRYTPEGFIVFVGSRARAVAVPSLQAPYKKLRTRLLGSGVFVPHDSHWVLTQDYRFNSPSQAAIVFAGRSASGWIEWKDEHGRTLRELQGLAVEGMVDVE